MGGVCTGWEGGGGKRRQTGADQGNRGNWVIGTGAKINDENLDRWTGAEKPVRGRYRRKGTAGAPAVPGRGTPPRSIERNVERLQPEDARK